MKALIYRTSALDGISVESPIKGATPIDVTGRYHWLLGEEETALYAWTVEVDSMADLIGIIEETKSEVIVFKPEYKVNVGQDINIEIYDDYRE